MLNLEKSELTPSQIIEFFGTMVDSVAMTLSLPGAKRQSMSSLCSKILGGSSVTLRELASLLGKLSFASSSVEFARLH